MSHQAPDWLLVMGHPAMSPWTFASFPPHHCDLLPCPVLSTPCYLKLSTETQELRWVLLVTLLYSNRWLWDITHTHQDLMQQQLVKVHALVLRSHQLVISPMSTHWTLHLPSILAKATDFHVADEDTQYTIDPGVLCHDLHTVKCQYWTHATDTNWWEQIILGIWDDEQWLQTSRMHWATFMDIVVQQPPPPITCQDFGGWPSPS